MKLTAFGLRYPDGNRMFEDIDEEALAERFVAGVQPLPPPPPAIRMAPRAAMTFGGGMAPTAPKDATNPFDAGWTYVVAEADPKRAELEQVIAPLAAHRRMSGKPLVFPADVGQLAAWVDEHYLGIAGTERPRYVLLLGSPEYLSFVLQNVLAGADAIVGRLDFDEIGHFATYIQKVISLEAEDAGACSANAVVFATDRGAADPTYYSLRFMATPIADMIDRASPFTSTRLFGPDATKKRLLGELSTSKPALVYTASHGLFAAENSGVQRAINGAICCLPADASDDGYLKASDVPDDKTPFAHGAMVMEFACWGYGTPVNSDFQPWRVPDSPSLQTSTPFVAALPKRLLSHPLGPIAFAGHVDTALMHGFSDPDKPTPELGALYNTRLEPFRTVINNALLRLWPTGIALDDLENRSAALSVSIASTISAMQLAQETVNTLSPDRLNQLVDLYVRRNDAANFLLLGDPGARLSVT